jgi:vancomycin resistance protein VanJ
VGGIDTTPRRKIGRATVILLLWGYALTLLAWFGLRLGWGDRLWWSALASSFTPYFFVPVLILAPFALFTRVWHARLAIFIPIALFLLLYGRLFVPRPALLQEPGPTLTVMTFNMWGGSRTAETAQVIAEAGYPDIVALQELTPLMTDVLLRELGSVYPHRVTRYFHAHRGLGLFSRAPLEPVAAPNLSGLERCDIQLARITTTEGATLVYNVHLHSTNLLRFLDFGVPIAQGTRESFARRALCIEAVLEDMSVRGEPVILLGDFNTTDQHDIYRMLRRSLHDAHRDAGWGFGHTFPADGSGYRGIPVKQQVIRIDMIFYDDTFRARSARVSDVHGESNHRPVIAELAWR